MELCRKVGRLYERIAMAEVNSPLPVLVRPPLDANCDSNVTNTWTLLLCFHQLASDRPGDSTLVTVRDSIVECRQ